MPGGWIPFRGSVAGNTSKSEYTRMTTGTVKFFNTAKGFGFIEPEDGTKDVFVHISSVERAGMSSLAEGQKVTFEIEQDARGPKAVNLADA